MCLLAICLSSLKKSLFRSFAHFSIESFLLLLLLSCMRCLYILQIKPLLATVSDKGSISEICKELLQLYENNKK